MTKPFINRVFSRFGYAIVKTVEQSKQATVKDSSSSPQTKAMCRSLLLHYQQLLKEKTPLPKLADVGFRVYSQCDEDGIILFLFSVAGMTNRVFVEVGAGNGVENNCANLAINLGWHGLFMDGDNENAALGTEFYNLHPDTRVFPPQFLLAKVDRDNINDLIRQEGFEGEIDFLSIDIDGMDYWIWQAIECVNPRIVVVEANGKFGMGALQYLMTQIGYIISQPILIIMELLCQRCFTHARHSCNYNIVHCINISRSLSSSSRE